MSSQPDASPTRTAVWISRVATAALVLGWFGLAWGHFRPLKGEYSWVAGLVGLGLGGLAGMALGGRWLAFWRWLVRLRRGPYLLVAACLSTIGAWVALSQALDFTPLSIDGSVYIFQARCLSHGHFGAPIPPSQVHFGVRFLLQGPDQRLYGVFPPGFPLFLSLFIRLGAPMLAGPLVAGAGALLCYFLGRQLGAGEGISRLVPLMAIPGFASACEHADTLSHGFAAVLLGFGLLCCLRLLEGAPIGNAIGVGGCAGWLFSARLLDGLVVGLFLLALLLYAVVRKKRSWLVLPIAAASALPFVVLLFANQHAATGDWLTPTQMAYFQQSDYPATCHRLGFGKDVGCAIEHTNTRNAFGVDGYQLDDAYKICAGRFGQLCADLFGYAPFMLLGLGWLRRARRQAVALTVLVFAFTLAYGLFYYGNAPYFGARHLFPLWVVVYPLVGLSFRHWARWAKGSGWRGRWVVGLAVAMFAGHTAAQAYRWRAELPLLKLSMQGLVNARRMAREAKLQRGIVVTKNFMSYLNSYDPWKDGNRLIFVLDDGSGLRELRRDFPHLPIYLALWPKTLTPIAPLAVPKDYQIELERVWPAQVTPHGLAATHLRSRKLFPLDTGGGGVLFLFHTDKGDSLEFPIIASESGHYQYRLRGMQAPIFGNYHLEIDGQPVVGWSGYHPQPRNAWGTWGKAIRLTKGRHRGRLVCDGKAKAAIKNLAALDTLEGRRVPPTH